MVQCSRIKEISEWKRVWAGGLAASERASKQAISTQRVSYEEHGYNAHPVMWYQTSRTSSAAPLILCFVYSFALEGSPASYMPSLFLSPWCSFHFGSARVTKSPRKMKLRETNARHEIDKESKFEAGLKPRDQDDEHQVHRKQSTKLHGLEEDGRYGADTIRKLLLSSIFFSLYLSPTLKRFKYLLPFCFLRWISLSSSRTRVGSQLPRDENPRCPPADTNGYLC